MAKIRINLVWTLLAADSVADFNIQWNSRLPVTFATTATANPPMVLGTAYEAGDELTRDHLGAGYVWARLTNSVVGGGVDLQVQLPTAAVSQSVFAENQYTKALYFGRTIVQTGAVHDFSRNGNDAIFAGGTTNAEVYNTEANLLSVVGGATGDKCLQIDPTKFAWQLNNGESLFMQARFKVVDIAGPGQVMGNSLAGTQPGLLVNVNSGGSVVVNMKMGVAGGIGYAAPVGLANNTFINMTLWVDGATKLMNGWLNGVQPTVWTNVQLVADSGGTFNTQFATPLPFSLGSSGSTLFPSAGNGGTRASRFEAVRLLTLPNGVMLQNAHMLDWKFNGQPISLVTDADIALV
jgi:hypothetical protein